MASSANLYTTILSLSPTLYYVCNEVTGSTITDYGSAKANLTLSGTYTLGANTLIASDPTSFLYLDSNTTNFSSKAQGNLSGFSVPLTGDYTITAIVKLYPNTSVNNTHIFSVGASGGNANANFQADLYYRTANGFVYNTQNGAKVNSTLPFTAYDELNRINYVMLVKNTASKFVKLYVFNSNLVAYNTTLRLGGFTPLQTNTYTTETTGGANATINLGATGDTNVLSNRMDIGHVAFFSRQLTNTEIFSLASNANFNVSSVLTLDSTSNTYAANVVSFFGSPSLTKPPITLTSDVFVDPFLTHPDFGYQIATTKY